MNVLPRITKNSWLTNSSNNSEYNDYPNGKRNLPKKYAMRGKDLDNAMNNIGFDFNNSDINSIIEPFGCSKSAVDKILGVNHCPPRW